MRTPLIYTILVLMLVVTACGGGGKRYTNDLDGKMQELNDKKKTLSTIKGEIASLEKEIKKLNPKAFEKEKKNTPITIDTADVRTFEEFVDIQGSIETKGNYTITSEMPGVLTSLTVSEGDYVKKGQLVGTIDVQSIQKSIAEIEQQLVFARDLYQRRSKLWNQKIGSEIEYLSAKNQVEALEKSLETVKVNLSKAQIYSPANGEIMMVNIHQGELASPGMPIATILNTSNLQIVADVPETYLKNVKKGEYINIEIPALEMEKRARISKISSVVNPANRTFKIEADVSNSGGVLKPNLLTLVKISKFRQPNAVVVPTNLIQQGLEGEFIYIVEESGGKKVAKQQNVKRGISANGETVIEKGLKGKEVLIAEGSRLVKNGDLVEIQ